MGAWKLEERWKKVGESRVVAGSNRPKFLVSLQIFAITNLAMTTPSHDDKHSELKKDVEDIDRWDKSFNRQTKSLVYIKNHDLHIAQLWQPASSLHNEVTLV